MNENEIIMNEEVMDAAEDLVQTNSGNGLKILGGVVALAGLAFGGYKLFKKRRAKKKMLTIPEDDRDERCEEECSNED